MTPFRADFYATDAATESIKEARHYCRVSRLATASWLRMGLRQEMRMWAHRAVAHARRYRQHRST